MGQLLRYQVLAGANGGHLCSDGVHVLTQGNPILLRLVPIGVKPCGKRMNMIYEGLSRTGGDLRSSSLGSPTLGVAVWTSSLVSSFDSSGLPNFALGSSIGRHCYTSSSESSIGTLASWYSRVIREGWIRAPVQCLWVNSINPYSMTVPMLNWKPLVIVYKRIVLSFVTILRCNVGLILTHRKLCQTLSTGVRDCI